MPIVDLLKQFAETKNDTLSQIALALLLAKKPFIVPIPGTRNKEHLYENLGAFDIQLTSSDILALDTASSKITIHGNA